MLNMIQRQRASLFSYLSKLLGSMRGLVYVFGGMLLLALQGNALAAVDAGFTSQVVPAEMVVGEAYPITITMKNTGTVSWLSTGSYALTLQEPSGWSVTSIKSTTTIAINGSRVSTATISPPQTPGVYRFQWCMTQAGVPFGTCSTPLSIVVSARVSAAEFVSQTMTESIASPSAPIRVTMKNTGNYPWKVADVTLGTQSPQDNLIWKTNRLQLLSPVAPGGNGVFSGNIFPPTQGGYYDMQWQTRTDTEGYFGQRTPPLRVAVADAAPSLNMLSPTAGQTFIGNAGKVDIPIRANATPTGIATIEKMEALVYTTDVGYTVLLTAEGPSIVGSINIPSANRTVYVRATDSFKKTTMLSATIVAQNDNSTLVSSAFPATMVPGMRYDVSIVLKNSGGTTWNPQSVSLVGTTTTHTTNWGDFSVPLDRVVAPGETAAFNFTLKAPETEGSFGFAMQLSESTRSRFGAQILKSLSVLRVPPTVTMTAPATGTTLDVPTDTSAGVTVQGSAVAGTNATISKLEVLDGTVVVATVNASNINQIVNLAQGTHSLKIRATDNWNETALSSIATVTVKSNDAAYVSQSVPATMQVGKAYTATVTMRNAGNKPWTAATGYALGAQNPMDNAFWRENRVRATATVAAGGQVSFSVPVTAPTIPGTYNFQWQMVQDDVEWFGPLTPNVQVVVKPLTPTVPGLISPMAAEKFTAVAGKAAVRVHGTATAGDGASISKLEVLDGVTVVATVDGDTIDAVVQLAAGAHTLKMRATDNFAQVVTGTATTAITVQTNSAAYVSRTVATSMVANNLYPVTVAMRNSGTTTWTPEEGYALGPVPDDKTWVADFVSLPGNVAPGATATFTFNVSAPADPGAYPFVWQMLQLNGPNSGAEPIREWFGTKSTLVNITVTGLPPTVTFNGPATGGTYAAVNGVAQVAVSGSAKAVGSATITKFEVLDGTKVIYTGSGNTLSTSVALAPGSHTLQLRATDSRNAVTLSQTSVVAVLQNNATFVSQSVPLSMYAGERYSVSLTVKNTGDITWQPSPGQAQPGMVLVEQPEGSKVWRSDGRVQLSKAVAPGEQYTFTFEVLAPAVAKQYPFQWRMSDESKEYFGGLSTLGTVNVSVAPVPVVTLSASPVNQRVVPGQSGNIALLGNAVSTGVTVAKLEVFADSGNGYSTTPVKSVSGSALQMNLSETVVLPNGSYRLKMRATDTAGRFGESPAVLVNVTDSALLGLVSGVRSTGVQDLQLVGWACRDNSVEPLTYQVHANAPAALGGMLVASGVANQSGGVDEAKVQQICHTPGAPHHFKIDLAGMRTQYPGAPLYVAASSTTGEKIVLPCEDHGCRIPDGLRIGLTSPNANGQDRYMLPIPVFARAVISGLAATPAEVAFNINGEWLPGADEGGGAYSVSKAGLPASAVPYTAYAKVRQGETTVITDSHQFYVDPGIVPGEVLPKSGTIVPLNHSVVLSTLVNAVVKPGQLVQFFIAPTTSPSALAASASRQGGPALKAPAAKVSTSSSMRMAADGGAVPVVGNATFDGTRWSYIWTPAQEGKYDVAAKLLDNGGVVLMQTPTSVITVGPDTNPADLPPLPIEMDTPHASNPNAGTLPGELGINNGGAATYSVPIVVPPGAAGMQPSISLDYNSQDGNSIVGLGWSLSGMSRIQRCGKTIAQDDVNARIDFSLADRLCLDGQRLVLVNLPVNDTNYWSDTAEYRTEIDGFSRILAQGTTAGGTLASRSFKVVAKDGRTMTYGSTASSVVQAVVSEINAGYKACAGGVPCKPAEKNGPIGWALDTIKDRYGNYISYNYTQDSKTGEHVPSDIRYGGSGLAPHAAIVFGTDETRSDAWTRYIDGARNDLRRRVNTISTYVGTDLSAGIATGVRIRSYMLSYERSPTSGRSLLNKIGVAARNPQTGADDVLPDTSFSWGKPDPAKKAGFELPVTFPGGPRLSRLNARNPVGNKMRSELFSFADFENHGVTDALEKSVYPLDFLPNQAYEYADRELKTSYRYYRNDGGKGFVEYSYTISTGEAFGVLETADFDGDGAPDLLAWNGTKLTICLSPLGKGVAPAVGAAIVFDCRADMPTTGLAAPRYRPFVTDVRGDGRSALYGSIGFPGAPSELCMQQECRFIADPPGNILGFGYAADGSPEFYRHDYADFAAMIDYTGVGKSFDTRFTTPHFVHLLSYDLVPSEVAMWVGMTPTISMLAIDDPDAPKGLAPMMDYSYRKYNPLGRITPPVDTRTPYSFESNYPGMGRSGDFNGSGYSGLAFGFREHSWNGNLLSYGKAEMTLCLSTGSSLDCGVRKKYSGSTVAAFDGPGTAERLQYLAVRGVGNFIGDGQPSILADSLTLQEGSPFPTPNMYMCRVMGDDVSKNADGADDSNISCDRWEGATMRGEGTGDKTFFMDVLGTGRTQLVNYHEDWQASAPNEISYSWSVAKPIDVAVNGQALDRIHAVTNGLNATSSVTYTEGVVDGTVKHSGTLALSYPQHLSSGVGKYATTLTTANGVSGNMVRTYRFQDPVIDLQGRGAMGFARVSVKTDQTQVETETDFHVLWPLTGMVRKAVVRLNDRLLSQTDNTVGVTPIVQANGQSTKFPAVLHSVVQRWEWTGADMGRTTTSGLAGGESSIYYDQYGNARSSRVVVDGGGSTFAHTTDTVNTYDAADVNRLYMGLPDSTVVTKSHNDVGGTAIARKVAFTYESTGKVKTQSIEPDDAALRIKSTFAYDPVFGVLLTKTLDWLDPDSGEQASRVDTTITYEPNARFPATIINAARHTETHIYDAGTGARASLTGPNGLTTTWQVDGFGRVTSELRADGGKTVMSQKQCLADCPASAVATTITEQFHGADRTAVPQVAYMDNVGHVLSTLTWGFDGAAITANKTYNTLGLQEDEQAPHYGDEGVTATHLENDALGRPVRQRTFGEDGGAADNDTVYDGLKVMFTNPKQQERVEHKNVVGAVTSVENLLKNPAKTLVTTFKHDAWGNLLSAIDPNGNVISVKYDTLGRKIQLNDPDLGQIDYSVNPLGLTWKQVSAVQRAKATATTGFTRTRYDALNRMVERVEDDLKSYWAYDIAKGGVGQLALAFSGTQTTPDYLRAHAYDDYGRPSTTTEQLSGEVYTSMPKYDIWGRLTSQSYQRGTGPVRQFAQRYNKFGYLARVERQGLVLWELNEQDAARRSVRATLGNGLVETDNYNKYSGRLVDSLTKAGNLYRLQEGYSYDKIGNVNIRSQHWGLTDGFIELFEYDDLNRLTLSQIGFVEKRFTYDDVGNLISKTGVGSGDYIYPAQGATARWPHAVSSITGVPGTFSYDDNGNLLGSPWHTVRWNNFDMPQKITKGDKWSSFIYGPEHQRIRQMRDDGTATVYAGAQEVELDSTGAVVTVKTYWPMGLGVEIERVNVATNELHWIHKDRLGSPVAISGESGVVQEMLAYDAWGKRRNANGDATPDTLDGKIDNRGFTGHEMLDALDLVHMNGRVFDPLVARFMSGDPLVQDPINGQGYNRYSYVLNNPTNLTDPTGFQTCNDSGGGCEKGLSVAAFVKSYGGDKYVNDKEDTRATKDEGKLNNVAGTKTENPKNQGSAIKTVAARPDAGVDGERGPKSIYPRTDIYAFPQEKGFRFVAIDNATKQTVEGEFNATTTNTNELGPGNYTISPREHVEEKTGFAGFKQKIGSMLSGNRDGDVNKHEGQPLISNTNQPGVVRGSDDAISKGITIHPGRGPTGEGGMSLGCMVCNTPTFNALNQLLNKNYDKGGAYLHIYPKNPEQNK